MKTVKLFIGSGLGSGYIPVAPGTMGSIVSLLPIYFILQYNIFYLIPAFVIVTSLLTLWVSKACEEEWGEDPGTLVMDEWAGQALAFGGLLFTEDIITNLVYLGIGFLFFRFFDILKPLGINKLQKYHGGWGILLDDLLAGFYALICLKTLIFFWS
jgi:phosphatidylglycerophosphatase A